MLLLPALVAVLAVGGCAGGGADGGGTSTADAELVERAPADAGAGDGLTDESFDAPGGKAGTGEPAPARQSAVISTGAVALLSDDVATSRTDVQQVVDLHRGQVTEETTETDDDGDVSHARMVVRVPAAEFATTMDELEQVADLESSSTASEDVTTQVIDTQARIRAQEKSLERVEFLLSRARTIRDIITIEAQLTRRQAELDSLTQQMAWLKDQTSMSTITVHVSATHDPRPEDEDDTGFLAGLSSGWDGLTTFATGLATVLGAVLPFAAVLALIGLPVWLVVRRSLRRRGRGAGTVSPEPPAPGPGQAG